MNSIMPALATIAAEKIAAVRSALQMATANAHDRTTIAPSSRDGPSSSKPSQWQRPEVEQESMRNLPSASAAGAAGMQSLLVRVS